MTTTTNSNSHNVFPKVCKKQELFSKFHRIPTRYLRQLTNETIAACRNMDLEYAKNIKILSKKEVTAIMVELGELETN